MSASQYTLLFVGIFVAFAAGDGPYPPVVPRVEVPVAPFIPEQTYGVPEVKLLPTPKIDTHYEYKLITPPRVLPLERTIHSIPVTYGVPEAKLFPTPNVATHYDYKLITPPRVFPLYDLAKIDYPIIAPHKSVTTNYHYNLFNPLKRIEVFPTPIHTEVISPLVVPSAKVDLPYGAPKIDIPIKPVLTTYDYNLPLHPIKRVEVVKPLVPEVPPTPHLTYGL